MKGGNDNGLNGPALKMISHPGRERERDLTKMIKITRVEEFNAVQSPTIEAR